MFKKWAIYLALTLMSTASPTPLPPFLHAQIEEDFKELKITKEEMEATWLVKKNNPNYIRYKYIDGVLTSSASQMRAHPRYIVVTEALEKILSHPLDFIIFLGDASYENTSPVPIFTFAKRQGAERLILIPDCEALNPTDRRYLTTLMRENRKNNPWAKKKDVSFWRGSPTGPKITLQDVEKGEWLHSPRFHLVKLSENSPQTIDAAFVNWIGYENVDLTKIFRKRGAVNPRDHLLYRYLIDVDGQSCCYSRTFWILLSNSIMLKQVTNDVQWFYKGLKPFVHFVPLNPHLTDLEEKIEFCRKNGERIQEIIKEANDFALNHLQYENNLAYLSQVLETYASRLQYTPTFDKEDVKAHVPLVRKIYFEVKGFLRKMIKAKPVASIT